MHELALTRSIVDIVVNSAREAGVKRVLSVRLIVGEMRNFEREWVQKYFDQCAAGTVAQNAQLTIDYVPITFYCNQCGATFRFNANKGMSMCCTNCGSKEYNMITGGELLIKDMEVE